MYILQARLQSNQISDLKSFILSCKLLILGWFDQSRR